MRKQQTLPKTEVYYPSPEEIREKCEEIQAGWTPADLRNRNGLWGHEPANTKEIKTAGVWSKRQRS